MLARNSDASSHGWLTISTLPTPFFCGTDQSKGLKTDYFYGFTELLIPMGLSGLICTKIVQIA